MVIDRKQGNVTKHYYNGASRIASHVGGGFSSHPDLTYDPLYDHTSTELSTGVPLPSGLGYEEKSQTLDTPWTRNADCAGLNEQMEFSYSMDVSYQFTNPGRDGERYFYHSDHLGSSAYITTENGYASQFLAYMPFGETLSEQQNSTSYYSPFKFSAKEKDMETGYSYFGARYYSPELGVWLSVDPMAQLAPGWTPYRYAFQNPIKFYDPNGMWEAKVETDANGRKNLVIIGERGDNFRTLARQTGISKKELKQYFSKDERKALGEGSRITKIGDRLNGINEALNEKDHTNSNCFGTAIGYALNRKVDPNYFIHSPFKADEILLKDFQEVYFPRLGDVVRYARPDGYASAKIDEWAKRALPRNGGEIGGTIHYATFLLTNSRGTQVFSKNGPSAAWSIMYDFELPKDYGSQMGINGGSSTFRR